MINQTDLIKNFSEIDDSGFPDFYSYKRPLEGGLWILWVAKEELGIKRLTAEQIASIIRDVKEVSVHAKSINNAFARAKGKIHIYHENGEVYFEIMEAGKKHLISQAKEGSIEVFYFEPGKRYTSKRFLSKNILDNLMGELKIVDPYCSERTLDILNGIENKTVKFLTRVENLRQRERNRFLRALQDFKSENSNIEFRNYSHTDIHDRYIISSKLLVILGHSIKDLGGKESFAIVLNRETSKNIFEVLIENFNRRWKQSNII
ncbi:hypothetical protein ES703_101218 [subsurface metagenome]